MKNKKKFIPKIKLSIKIKTRKWVEINDGTNGTYSTKVQSN